MSSRASHPKIRNPQGNTSSITDPRFANFHTDPRYRLPSKRRHNIQVDKRFSRVLHDDDFARKAKVDRYGRPISAQSEKNKLKRLYNFDEDDEPDDDSEVQRELKRVKKDYDPIRDGGYTSSSGSSSEEEDEVEGGETAVEAIPAAEQEQDIPTGDVSTRIAVVNLDWDNIQAADLMAVFSSFLPNSGRILDISIYPSEFGRERMEQEELEGPPKEIFTSKTALTQGNFSNSDPEEENDEEIKRSILKPDSGEDFDSRKLRQYQLERLRYFYAVLTCSTAAVAKSLYDAVDGTEYLSSANFFDLRFIPDSTDFSSDKPRDTCQSVPPGYKPNSFVTEALQHSKIKLTWDAEDTTRKEVQARVFRGSRKEIDENDLKAYLGSDSSSSEPESDHKDSQSAKKEEARGRTRALLGLTSHSVPRPLPKVDTPVGDMQITFTAGLSANTEPRSRESVFVNDPAESTIDRYVRKERERKRARKDKLRHLSRPALEQAKKEEEAQDLGFDDPFFAAGTQYPEKGQQEQKSTSAARREEKRKKRAERAEAEAVAAAQKAELKRLMPDGEREPRHFDMLAIEKAERRRRKGRKVRRKDVEGEREGDGEGDGDGFAMDVKDPRFERVYTDHDFAIDPTSSRFRETEGMRSVLEEGRRRRREVVD